MAGDAISVQGLRKSYDGTDAVAGVDFSVPAGEVFALLGPNGAGKTTTVEILEGYRRRDAGQVRVLGVDPGHGGRRFRERIGIVLQECAVEPYLTVEEALRMTAARYPSPRPPAELLEIVGLTDARRTRVKVLSGGQRRRLDLALALVGDPELIFLDEPTTGFDPSARRASWDVIRDLCSLGKTVLLTTHYMDEAQALASQVCVIARGRIVASGTPDDLGGRDRAADVVTFSLPHGASLAELPAPGATIDAGRVRVEVPSGRSTTALVHELTGWALARGAELAGLSVTRPTLEDTYLRLTSDATALAGEVVGEWS